MKGNTKSSGPKAVTKFAKTGSNPKNPSRQAANTKNAQGKAGAGAKQIGIHRAASVPAAAGRGLGKTNSAPFNLLNNGRNKSPLAPTTKGHNAVSRGDVTRVKAANLQTNGMQKGGGFKSYIGGK